MSSGFRVPYGELRCEEVADDSRDSALKSTPLSPWLLLKPCCAQHKVLDPVPKLQECLEGRLHVALTHLPSHLTSQVQS